MVVKPIECPCCHGVKIIKFGKASNGKQRFQCQNEACECNTFIENYSYPGLLSETKKKIIEMAINSSGVRDTARVLKVSVATVIAELKKKNNALNL